MEFKENLKCLVSVSFTQSEIKTIEACARKLKVSRSAFIRACVKNQLKAAEKSKNR